MTVTLLLNGQLRLFIMIRILCEKAIDTVIKDLCQQDLQTSAAVLKKMLPLLKKLKVSCCPGLPIPDICVNTGYMSVFGHRLTHRQMITSNSMVKERLRVHTQS